MHDRDRKTDSDEPGQHSERESESTRSIPPLPFAILTAAVAFAPGVGYVLLALAFPTLRQPIADRGWEAFSVVWLIVLTPGVTFLWSAHVFSRWGIDTAWEVVAAFLSTTWNIRVGADSR